MAKKKKNLVEKVKEAFTKEVKEEVQEVTETVEQEPTERAVDFGVPSEDEVLEELKDGE